MAVLPSSAVHYLHVIWDWNGTLFDDTSLCVQVMRGMLRRRGLGDLDEDRYRQIFTFPVRAYYERLGFDLDAEEFSDLAIEFHDGYLPRWRKRPLRTGALKISDALRDAGVSQSILSAAEQEMLNDCARHFALDSRMTAVIGTDDYHGHTKEDRGMAYLDELHVPPDRALFVGDTVHDYEVATAMGVDCVLMAGGHATRERLESTGAHVVDSPTGVLDALR